MADNHAHIVIKKKKSAHGTTHSGAWKVAYADFVTAMMALFIVLWLMSSTTRQQQEEIAGYFRDPKGTASHRGVERQSKGSALLVQPQDMNKLKAELLQSIARVDLGDKLKKHIEITMTPEGLRIELIEDANGTFFTTGSAQPTPALVSILKAVSAQLGTLPNHLSIEGHTDAQPYVSELVYGNWELSSDRANVARRLMQLSGVRQNQVAQVRGYADQQLRNARNPFDAANRRISLIVQYLDGSEQAPATLPTGTMIAAAAGTSSAKPATAPGAGRAASAGSNASDAATGKPLEGRHPPAASRPAQPEATPGQASTRTGG